jgi:hypothetical protein
MTFVRRLCAVCSSPLPPLPPRGYLVGNLFCFSRLAVICAAKDVILMNLLLKSSIHTGYG